METRKSYRKEFRIQTVKYILENKKSLPVLADELGINLGTLRNWVLQYRDSADETLMAGTDPSPSLPDSGMIKELQQENKELKDEIANLKKAMGKIPKKPQS